MTGDDLLEQLQGDVLAVLANTPELADANVILQDEGDMEKEILRHLGSLTGGPTGKNGLVLVVMLPEIDAAESNLPGPPISASIEIQVIEAPKINRGATGTGIRSSVAALRTLAALHLRGLGTSALHAGADPLKPVQVKPGYLSHAVRLKVAYRALPPPPKPAGVSAEWLTGPGALQLTCATPLSAIWYTMDGSYPHPSNPLASLYTEPISGPSQATTFRTAAYLSGAVPGDLTEVAYTA